MPLIVLNWIFLGAFTDSSEIFEVLHNSLDGTPSEPFFLSILQHLLSIRDDEWARYLGFSRVIV